MRLACLSRCLNNPSSIGDRMPRLNSDIILGVVASLAGLTAIFLWIPLDTGTGIVEQVRGSYVIGDALAPTVSSALLALAGIILLMEARGKDVSSSISLSNVFYLIALLAIIVVAIGLMRWTGPIVAYLYGLITGGAIPYRNLRDAVPWKYLGYFSGGTVLVGGLICLSKKKITLAAFVIGFCASVAMILFYDLPFDTLLLPPNGDL